jgi:hypothetical protein
MRKPTELWAFSKFENVVARSVLCDEAISKKIVHLVGDVRHTRLAMTY